jgi:co-chaperonin GroES (HSP10)
VDFQRTGINDNVARRGEVIIPMFEHECKKGSVVWFKNLYSVDMWVEGTELVNVREKDLLAIENEAA